MAAILHAASNSDDLMTPTVASGTDTAEATPRTYFDTHADSWLRYEMDSRMCRQSSHSSW